jgi:hypothetical protein
MSATTCLLLYVGLTLSVWAGFFVRARAWRKVNRLARAHFGDGDSLREEQGIYRLLPHPAEMRRLKALKRDSEGATAELQEALRQYTLASRITFLLAALLICLALFGYRICN